MKLDRFAKILSKALYHTLFGLTISVFLFPGPDPTNDLKVAMLFTLIGMLFFGFSHLTELET